MALAGEILSLLKDSASPDIRPEEASERLWHLTYPSFFASHGRERYTHVDTVKVRLLETMARTGTAIIHHPDSPREEKLPGEWIAGQQPNAWHVPLDLNLGDESISYWLFDLGNWTILAPDVVTTRLPDFASANAAAALSWVDEQHIQVVIDSFHDDVSWVVVLGSERPAA